MKIKEFLPPGIRQQQDLNSIIWQDENTIHPEVRAKLIKIASFFKEYIEIDFPIVDIVVTGGQTGKFYTESSDLDLHLITDFDKIDCDQEVAELFDTKRNLFNKEYNIKIKGIPVEVYVEDVKQPAVGGAYSILKQQWLRQANQPNGQIDDEKIKIKSQELFDLISKSLTLDNLELLDQMKDLIWNYRKQGLQKQGEFGVANLVFKSLRNSGILDQLRSKIKDLESQKFGLK